MAQPDHPAGGQVDHGGQIGPALPGPHVGDVATLDPVDSHGAAARRRALDQDLAGRPAGSATWCVLPAPLGSARPGRAGAISRATRLRPTCSPARRSCADGPGRSRRCRGLGVDVVDACSSQLVVGSSALDGRWAVSPVIEGGTGDLEQLARLGDVALPDLLRLDERDRRSSGLPGEETHGPLEDVALLAHLAQLLAQLGDLLALRRWSARRAQPASISACVTQRRTAVSVRSSSRATPPPCCRGWRAKARRPRP